jgi:hypothetical protein
MNETITTGNPQGVEFKEQELTLKFYYVFTDI